MKNLFDLDLNELTAELRSLGLPAFRGRQLFTWLHRRLTLDFSVMDDLPRELRDRLAATFKLELPAVIKVEHARDGASKYLLALADGERIESVLLVDETGRKTVCLSTQAGCPLACTFCATGGMGFKRNLTVAEIIGQVYRLAAEHADLSNLVLMGMGEPFLNYENVMKALRILTAREGANFGQRKITLSTCGIPEKIKRFADESLQVRLALSLNAADDHTRSRLMPINRKYDLGQVMDAVRYYIRRTGRRVTVEYVLLDGVNDRKEDLKNLIALLQGLTVNVNLIPLNPFEKAQGKPSGKKYRPSPLTVVERFRKILLAEKINAVIRRSRGANIRAACGQLAAADH